MSDYPTKVVEIVEVASDVLTEWECTFIEDQQWRQHFSYKQKSVIDRIYDKVCDSTF